jgi:predicted site-specific integrase-resolvase
MEKLISINKASKLLGISDWSLRRYSENTIKPVLTEGGHRRYRLSDILKLQGVVETKEEQPVAIYCRVSTGDQKNKGDLTRQKERLVDYCVKNSLKIEHIFEEVGSGLNDKRKKLRELFTLVSTNKVSRVIIEHKDRLTRFNYNIFEHFINSYGVVIDCIETVLPKSFENELVTDILTIMSCYSAKIYGIRSHMNKKKENENKQSI